MTKFKSNTENRFDGSLDWALLHLLQNVKSDVVNPIIKKWRRALKKDTEGDDNTVHNLTETLKYVGRNVVAKANSKEPYIIQQLNEVGMELFSSYYFIAIAAHTEEGEYMLFPAVPGRSGLNTQLKDDQDEFVEFLNTIQLPFRNVGERMPEYSTNMLPGRVGLTPQVCRIAVKRDEVAVHRVDNFVGDLALIGREEDVVQRHASALICPLLSPEKAVLGAFVLTCQMPGAFDDKDAAKLEKVLDVWMKAPLEKLHARARHETTKTVLGYKWSEISTSGVDDRHLKNLMEIELESKAANGASCMGVTFSKGGEERAIAVVNIGAVTTSLNAVLTPGPLLARSQYTVPFPNDDEHSVRAVSHSGISNLVNVCKEAGNFESGIAIEKTPLFSTVLKNLLPLVKSNLATGKTTRSFQRKDKEFTIIVTANIPNNMEDSLSRRLKEVLKNLHAHKGKQAIFFPGQSCKLFAELETIYHTESYTDTIPESKALADAVQFYKNMKNILDEFDASSIFIFEDKSCFVADSCKQWTGMEDLSRILHIPASYWVFETICNILTMPNFNFDNFRGHNAFRILEQFKSELPNAINVRFSANETANNDIISAINFLAIPVRDWEAKRKPDIDVRKPNLSGQLMTVYHQYIEKLLANPSEFAPLNRVLKSDGQIGRDDWIQKIVVKSKTEDEVVFGISTKDRDDVNFTWKRQHTKTLRFSMLNADHVSTNAAQNLEHIKSESSIPETKIWKIAEGWKNYTGPPNITEEISNLERENRDKLDKREKVLIQIRSHESQWISEAQQVISQFINLSEDCIETGQLDYVKERAKDIRLNIGLHQIQNMQDSEIASNILSMFGSGNFEDKIIYLCKISVRMGVLAAAKSIDLDATLSNDPDIDEWDDFFINGFTSGNWVSFDKDLDFHPLEKTHGKLEVAISTIVGAVENLVKHTLIDLFRYFETTSYKKTTIDPYDHGAKEHLLRLQKSIKVIFTSKCIYTENEVYFELDTPPKKCGTRRTLESYLTKPIWGNKDRGSVGIWGGTQKDKFVVQLNLPIGFWRHHEKNKNI